MIEYKIVYGGKINRDGYLPIPDAEVWVHLESKDIIVFATPSEFDDEETGHNCDEMGCSSFDHIVLRGTAHRIGY